MRRTLVYLVALVAAGLAAHGACRLLQSEEARIAERFEGMARAFNGRRLSRCLDGLAEDFRDETSGAGKDAVRQGLLYLFFRKLDARTQGPAYRVELPRGGRRIALDRQDPARAEAVLSARFFERRGGKERCVWEVRIEAEVVKEEGAWRVRRTRHETLSGSSRF